MTTWRTLPASPDIALGQAVDPLERDQLQALLPGQVPEHQLHVDQQRRQVEGFDRQLSSRPASIFDISRMSLMSVSR